MVNFTLQQSTQMRDGLDDGISPLQAEQSKLQNPSW